MAERRMFAKTIIDSDVFLEMPLSTQALYFHLAMRADDDGFVNNPKKIQRMINADDDSLRLLCAKKFLIPFESGVVVIRHWKLHNYIQKDRYKETVYQEEKRALELQSNGIYKELDTECVHDVYKPDTQVRLGKVSIGKVNNMGDETENKSPEICPPDKKPSKRFIKPTLEEVRAYCQERNNSVDPERFINYYESNGWKVGKNSMKDWKAAVRTWENSGYNNKKQEQRLPTAEDYDFSDWYK